MRAAAAISQHWWEDSLRKSVRTALREDSFYRALLEIDSRLHLAVLVEPYLSLLLSGRKTVESRFSMTRRSPFRQVKANDILILKRSAGPVVGVCRVAEVQFYQLDRATLAHLRKTFHESLAIEDERFWERQGEMRYATLMRVSHAMALDGIRCGKRDQRGWVTLAT
jgi:ASC-1-like (ASCH) protein